MGTVGRRTSVTKVLALVAIALATMAQQDACSEFEEGVEEGSREPGSEAGAGKTIDNGNLDRAS